MLSLTTSAWFDLSVAVLNDYGCNDQDDVRQILYDNYRVRARFASPRGKQFKYQLEFDDPKLKILFKLKYSEYIDAD